MSTKIFFRLSFLLLLLTTFSCNEKGANPRSGQISELNLKRGKVISCGDARGEFGSASFENSCGPDTKEDFNLAIKLLHSFEYDEAEKVFAAIIDKNPGCAMAYWGVAMSNFHPLWVPPTQAELQKGSAAIALAQQVKQKSKRETEYIEAIAAYYNGWEKENHRTRCLRFEKAMESLYQNYPDDKEAAIFYALALNAAVDPSDKLFTRQKKAGDVLNNLYPDQPNHPGIIHYIIHTYDYPGLATQALTTARRYATVAPSSAHALHMPSHIFTRTGRWDESILSDSASVAAAKCYAESSGIKGHWDEELHGMDYLVYAYLQKGDNEQAEKQLAYLNTITEIHPANFKVAYSCAAIPSRILLENKRWRETSRLQLPQKNFSWESFPWQKAIVHFTKVLGAVHQKDAGAAQTELQELKRLHTLLADKKESYYANQVLIQLTAAEAWMKWMEGKKTEALQLMIRAAEMEDNTEKHPVTPGEIIPARELLGDLLMQLNEPGKALAAYEEDLVRHPNRFNNLYGAGRAAEKSGDFARAADYYRRLVEMTIPGSKRPELVAARQFLKKQASYAVAGFK